MSTAAAEYLPADSEDGVQLSAERPAISVKTEKSPAAGEPPPVRTWVFSSLVRDRRLTAGAFRLWHLLFDMSRSSGRCWPGERHLAALLRCSDRSLRPWREALVALGYLSVARIAENNRPPGCNGRKHGGFIYTVQTPDRRHQRQGAIFAVRREPPPAAIKRTRQNDAQRRTKLNKSTKTPPYSPRTGNGGIETVADRPDKTGSDAGERSATANDDDKQHTTETERSASMKTTRADTKRELLRLARYNSESIRQLLSDPASYSDRKVSIPDRLTPSAVARLTKLERLATQFGKDLRR